MVLPLPRGKSSPHMLHASPSGALPAVGTDPRPACGYADVEYPPNSDMPCRCIPPSSEARKFTSSSKDCPRHNEAVIPIRIHNGLGRKRMFLFLSTRNGTILEIAVSQFAGPHLVHQRPIADIQGFGRAAPVPAVLVKRLHNELGFHLSGCLADFLPQGCVFGHRQFTCPTFHPCVTGLLHSRHWKAIFEPYGKTWDSDKPPIAPVQFFAQFAKLCRTVRALRYTVFNRS